MRLARTAVLAAVLSPLACGAGLAAGQGPSETLRAYALALDEGRADDAYRLLSQEARRSMSLEAFRRAVRDNPDDVREIARAISRPAADPLVTATVTMPDGDELVLTLEGGVWRIDAAAVDLYGQATPRQAIAGFLRAYERKRYDVVVRYMPDAETDEPAADAPARDAEPAAADAGVADAGAAAEKPKPPAGAGLMAERVRAAWEGPQKEEIARLARAIRAALPTAAIEETGDSATMPYGGGSVALVREHGVWKIKDF